MLETQHAPAHADPLILRSLEPVALEVPLPAPTQTPFGEVRTVIALLVLARDADGVEGWGEIWCNFPRFGYRHRAALLREAFAPAIIGVTSTPSSPAARTTAICCRSWSRLPLSEGR